MKKKEEKVKRPTRAEAFGIAFADSIIEAAHLTYNAPRGIKIVEACIRRLQGRISEIQPKGNDFNKKLEKSGKPTRQEDLGNMLADALIEAAHQTYNAPRGVSIVQACIEKLQERVNEIQPQKATQKYYEARYGKKKKK